MPQGLKIILKNTIISKLLVPKVFSTKVKCLLLALMFHPSHQDRNIHHNYLCKDCANSWFL